MDVIVKPNGSGKTTVLVKWAAAARNRYIITPTFSQAKMAVRCARMLGITAAELPDDAVLCVAQWLSVRHGLPNNVEIAVDELDAVLMLLLGRDVAVATSTLKSVPPYPVDV